MITTQPLEVSDFSGGFTDNYIDGPILQCQYNDNLLITSNRKLRSRAGSTLFDLANAQIPVGAQRIGAVINWQHDRELLVQSARNLYRYSNGWQVIQGPHGNPVLDAGTTLESISWTEWDRQLYITNDSLLSPVMKLYVDENGAIQVRTAGLPIYPDVPGPTITPTAGANTYIYAFLYFNTYFVEQTLYEDYGTPIYRQVNNADAPNVNAIAITNLVHVPATSNYPTTAKIKIYRTIAGGSTFYEVGEVPAGTTTFNDSLIDTALSNKVLLYTSGDVNNDAPPISKFVHIVNGTAYYAYVKEGSQVYPNRILQSIPGDPDSVPGSFYASVVTDLTGLSSVNGVPIALTRKGIYRLDGIIDELGGGNLVPKIISDIHGCVSHNSIVQTQRGIFWAGLDGFCFSNGMDVMKISSHLDQSYNALVRDDQRAKRIVGTLDSDGNRIYWAVQWSDGSIDNDSIWVCDIRWGISQQSSFSTISGRKSFAPSSVAFFKDELIRADTRGYVFVHRDSLRSDPVVNTSTLPSTWQEQAVLYDYRSCSSNFGTQFMRKWVPKIIINAANEGSLHLQINSSNDNSGVFKPLAPISFRGALEWGDPEFMWGDPGLIWNYNKMIEEQRRFPAKGLRCSRKQIQLTNAYTLIAKSTSASQGIVNRASKTVTFASVSTYRWPNDSVGFYITFSYDNYDKQYLITAGTDTTITFSDIEDTIISGMYDWQLLGYPKNEILHLLGFTVEFGLISQTQKPYQPANDGRVTWT